MPVKRQGSTLSTTEAALHRIKYPSFLVGSGATDTLNVVQAISLKGCGTYYGDHLTLYPHNEILRFAQDDIRE